MKLLFVALLLCLALSFQANAQQYVNITTAMTDSAKCASTSDTNCRCDGITMPCRVTLGTQWIRIIVEANNAIDPVSRFYPFDIRLIDLSYLVLAGDIFDFMSKSYDSYIRVWVGDATASRVSPKRNFFSRDGNQFVAFYTTIISFKLGYLGYEFQTTGNTTTQTSPIQFDSSCQFGSCSVSGGNYGCIEGPYNSECGIPFTDGNVPSELTDQKGLKLYVGFTGTDVAFSPFRSAGNMPTKFRFLSWSSIFGPMSAAVSAVPPATTT